MVPAIFFWNGEGLSREPYTEIIITVYVLFDGIYFDGIYGRDCLFGVPPIGRLSF